MLFAPKAVHWSLPHRFRWRHNRHTTRPPGGAKKLILGTQMVNQPRLSTSAKTGGSKAHRRLFFWPRRWALPSRFPPPRRSPRGRSARGHTCRILLLIRRQYGWRSIPSLPSMWRSCRGQPATARGNLPRRGASTGRVEAFQTFRIGGSTPSTSYRFRVLRGRDELDTGTFSTAPAATDGRPVSFAVYGDNRSDDAAHEACGSCRSQGSGVTS